MKLWNAATGREVGSLRGHSQHVLGVAFRPDGRQLASASGAWRTHDAFERRTGEIKVWDLPSGSRCPHPLGSRRPRHGRRFQPRWPAPCQRRRRPGRATLGLRLGPAARHGTRPSRLDQRPGVRPSGGMGRDVESRRHRPCLGYRDRPGADRPARAHGRGRMRRGAARRQAYRLGRLGPDDQGLGSRQRSPPSSSAATAGRWPAWPSSPTAAVS